MPTFRTAVELIRMLEARKISARELCDEAIDCIEALDTRINAVVVRDFERARDAADAADVALSRGGHRPLLGVPMTVKEQFNIAGLATTWGHPQFRDWRPNEDALTVARLKTAGAVILGKTNVPLGLADWQSYNEIYGTTSNPWDLGRSPGGSSGGGAAALAAGMVPLEFGSDIGGSLRAPAHFCGVFSHKPSLDLVPQRGAGPPGTPAFSIRGDLAVIGPMARSAADLSLLLDVLAGPDEWAEGLGYTLSLPRSRHNQIADFRVLMLDAHPLCPTARSVTNAINELAERLGKLGCRIVRFTPGLPELAQTTRVYVELLAAFFSADLAPERRERLADSAKGRADDDSIAACRLRGFRMSHSEWILATRQRFALTGRWRALFDDIDVILCPAMPTPAFAHDHAPIDERMLDLDGRTLPYGDQIAWATIAILNGLPATTLPVGRTSDGLPIGAQIVGGFLQDRTTIAFAELIEREFGGFTPPPNL